MLRIGSLSNPGRALLLTLLSAAVGLGCTVESPTVDPDFQGQGGGGGGGDGNLGGSPGELFGGVGDACSDTEPCRPGLDCVEGECVPSGSSEDGSACVIAAECAGGQCVLGACTEAGDGAAGDACDGDVNCEAGLRCQLLGLTGVCEEAGEGDLGDECTQNADCFAGLFCREGLCSAPAVDSPTGGSLWTGVECEPPVEQGPVRAYFEVPGAEEALELDFFRLPFPNDARRNQAGRLNLEGFPTPGSALLGFDAVQRYVDATEADDRGWGTSPTVVFRFSGGLDLDSMQDEGRVNWIDITPDTEQYGTSVGWEWLASGGRSKYICENRLMIKRPSAFPLVPGHVYAVYVTRGLRDQWDGEVEPSPNFVSMLADAQPDDPALTDAHASFAPFRDYLEAEGLEPDSILTASVLTIADTREPMAELAAAVAAADPPTATNWVRCDSGVASPCPVADPDGVRSCGAPTSDYVEYHALVELPIFQTGEPPYLTEGGGIETGAPVRTEEVCLALTVPTGEMPEAGWPLVVFAHGTGGDFRDHVRSEVAGALARASLTDGTPVGMAVLGIDQVSHANRRGDSEESPENLFFNFTNPAAIRGNPLQGAADQLALARLAESLDVTVEGARILIDPNALSFFGHSQGSTEGSLMLPYGPAYKAAVLSGNGASLRDSLLTKTQPVNIKAVMPLLLSDTDLLTENAAYHPVLSLLQGWIDPADPINFAGVLVREPVVDGERRHIFQTYGLGDTYSPGATMAAFALAASVVLVENDQVSSPESIGNKEPTPPPVSGNLAGFTLGLRQYAPPEGRDGHFVVFDVARANADMVRFLGMASAGLVPEIGE